MKIMAHFKIIRDDGKYSLVLIKMYKILTEVSHKLSVEAQNTETHFSMSV